MRKKILGVVLVLVVVFVVAVSSRPAQFSIERSATMVAPPSRVFEHVDDFRKWESWSPWAKLDPSMKVEFSGASSGPGAVYHWTGNQEVGEGRMTLLESQTSERVKIRLEFIKPFATVNLTESSFREEGGRTTVRWAMSGENSFFMKAFHLFMNMDKMVGKDFEKGLANLKAVVESSAPKPKEPVKSPNP